MTRKNLFAPTLVVVFILIAAAVAAWPAAAGSVHATADAVPGRYLVMLADGVARGAGADDPRPTVPDVARALGRSHHAQIEATFEHALQGFTVSTDAAGAQAIAADPRVAFVEADAWVSAAGVQVPTPSWGLDRIDQRSGALDGAFHFGAQGNGIRVFVFDTGIRSTHADLAGRVDTADGYTAIADGFGTEDCNGHGTHVAGIAGGFTYGAAKAVILHPVRVLGCEGSGYLSDVIAAVDWMVAEVGAHQKGPAAKHWRAVANLSLEAPASYVLDIAVRKAVASGIPVVASAGNGAVDACAFSPSGVSEALVVGATEEADQIAAFSNGGPCVDLLAPGVGIVSSWVRDDADAVALSGTSAAAAHVTAVVATLLERYPSLRPQDVERLLVERATAGMAGGTPYGTTDRLLYSAFADDGVDDPAFAAFTVDCSSRRACTFDAGLSFDDTDVASYAWDFGDGATGTGAKARHRYDDAAPGPYAVTLTLTDGAGQVSRHTVEVGTYWN
jgi:subtilisin family serine protease